MNLFLKRSQFRGDGIFGQFFFQNGDPFCLTLEHPYSQGDNWVPKVASGVYTCIRHPANRLPYETFMLQDVPPFEEQLVSGILIHIGNFANDSEGCILIGNKISELQNGSQALTSSKDTFIRFMKLQAGVDSFQLTIL